jgi:HPt (histidine-containing phosphotransfer) domain-containing protein
MSEVGTGNSPVLDERIFAGLEAELSDALLSEVVATFAIEVGERIAAIERAVADRDCRRAGAQGHALKGSAGTFGAVALCCLADAVEGAGRDGDLALVRAQLAPLRDCGEALLTVLRERCDRVSPS